MRFGDNRVSEILEARWVHGRFQEFQESELEVLGYQLGKGP